MAPEPTPAPAPAGADNPFAGLTADFSVFGGEFTTWWQKLFVGLWALCLVAAGVYLLVSLVKLHKATNNNIPGQADEAKTAALWAGGALGALAGFAVITGAIFTLAG
jgi:hypothetical protein